MRGVTVGVAVGAEASRRSVPPSAMMPMKPTPSTSATSANTHAARGPGSGAWRFT